MGNLYKRVYEIVKSIPKGKVATYGQIAFLLGNIRLSQRVGYALHSNPDPKTIPCHRVVNRFGRLADAFKFGGVNRQKELLESEGVLVREDNTVDLEIYGAKFEDFNI